MRIELIDINGTFIAELISDSVEINSAQDALDLMANYIYQGVSKTIIHEINICLDFFELKQV